MEFVKSDIQQKIVEFVKPLQCYLCQTLTSTSILLNIISYLQLLLDEYLLFTDIILDISIRVPNYLDVIIPSLVSTVPLDWNILSKYLVEPLSLGNLIQFS